MTKRKNRAEIARKPYFKKTALSNESLPHLQWELCSFSKTPEKLMADYEMSGSRTIKVQAARLAALDCVLANICNGKSIIVPNFSEIKADELDFAKTVFLDVLNHLEKVALIGREGAGYKRSIITYSSRIMRYRPERIIFKPKAPVMMRIKEEDNILKKVNTTHRKRLKESIKKIWDFYQRHDIKPGIDRETFDIFNQLEIEVHNKEKLIFPNPAKILPYIVFSDRNLTKGGRMYGAFWIGEKKILRRAITIDGELTADIDGKGMHVQLLYRKRKIEMPAGDPYIFTGDDERRAITKRLMLLMMNTRKEMSCAEGRRAVARTYRQHYGDDKHIEDLALELEAHHSQILDRLYKPNWGDLQRTEAAIMLSIMERGMADDIVILPVHDGCLCPRQYKDRVMGYFSDAEIVAEENLKHQDELPVEEAIALLAANRKYAQAA